MTIVLVTVGRHSAIANLLEKHSVCIELIGKNGVAKSVLLGFLSSSEDAPALSGRSRVFERQDAGFCSRNKCILSNVLANPSLDVA